ncbi:uncharacterized protein LOC5507401 [Nematostella vectensis]|uniref:uncharacterized protein LOC5507401 n=1 Tax=Nematostella vectensis TaxID=45351 RepID=UPI0020777CE8|nr:uncharacterized protein LOC5507401 [Nematostella vectensis]
MAAGLCSLPEEIILHILSLLHTSDILSLSRVCKTLYELTNIDSVWRSRFRSSQDHLLKLTSAENQTTTWKKLYFKAGYALSFKARVTGKSGEMLCAEFVRKPNSSMVNGVRFDNESPREMTVETWIKLNPRKHDGIIIGCQSESVRSHRWPQYHWQIMHVGPDGCIRGSLEPYKFMKGPNLNDNKWHHVAITASSEMQILMVDGRAADSVNFGIGREYHRRFMTYSQIGNGVISHGSSTPWDSNAMKPGHCGWYPFCGQIRELRVWSGKLPESTIQQNMYIHRIDMLQDEQYAVQGCKLIGYWPMTRLVSGPWPWQGSLVSCTSHLEENRENTSHLNMVQSHLP